MVRVKFRYVNLSLCLWLILPNKFSWCNRYVVVKVVLEDESKKDGLSFSDHSIYNCVLKLVQKHWGDLGEAAVRSGLRCKYCNDQTRIAIIRIKHRPHRFVTSVLPLACVVSFLFIDYEINDKYLSRSNRSANTPLSCTPFTTVQQSCNAINLLFNIREPIWIEWSAVRQYHRCCTKSWRIKWWVSQEPREVRIFYIIFIISL